MNVTRQKEQHYKMIKGSIQEDYIKILNIYTPNRSNSGKREIDSNTVIVGDLTLHLHQWTDHPDRKSVRIASLNWVIRPDGLNWYLQTIPSESSKHHKDQSRNKWNKDKEKNRKDQWN